MPLPEAGTSPCSMCLFRHVCADADPPVPASPARAAPVLHPARVHVRAGEPLYRQGRPVLAVYPIRQGSTKSLYQSPLGWRQVTGFSLPGDVIGMEQNEATTHAVSAIALQDMTCCAVPVEALREQMAHASFRQGVMDALRRDAERERVLLVAIGSMKASQRVAMLLLDLAGEQRRRGYPDGTLTLAMSRNDIASYLGLTLETVSRLLSRFASEGLITVRQRLLRIVDQAGLASVYADPERVTIRNAGAPAGRDAQAGHPMM